jgi:VanZ family protein
MSEPTRLRPGPFVTAIVVSVLVVLSAPVAGQIRAWIRATFPGRFVVIVGGLGALLLVAAIVAAGRRIRERRAARYGAIAAAIALAAIYSAFNVADNPESTAVERFHFLEYGLITFLFYRAWRPLGDLSIVLLPILAGLTVGTAEEWLQWFIPNRVGELRDIFLNLAAIVSGLLFSAGVEPAERFHLTIGRRSAPRVLRMAAVTLLALAAFIHSVHLGYVVSDPSIGTFTSRYSSERLPALQQEKAREWSLNPPPLVLRRISREDQYLSEGLAHVRWRNKQWDAGNHLAAWNENLILEKYFAPVLDTPTYEGRAGHRWPAEQRADAAGRAAGVPAAAPYVSAAYPYEVYTWRKSVFWSVAIMLAGALRGLSVATRRRRQ